MKYAEQARKLALLGTTDAEMARFFGVSEATLHRWKHAHRDFCESIKDGKERADSEVAASLYRAALGNGVIVETKEQIDAEGRITKTKETRQIPPSTTAMIFWLKNRQPDKWRDRLEHQTEVTLIEPDSEALMYIYEEKMRQARERQAAVLKERGLNDNSNGEH